MPLPNLDSIGEWSPTQLARFVQEILSTNPPEFPKSMELDSLDVGGLVQIGGDLIVGGEIISNTGIVLPHALVTRTDNQAVSNNTTESVNMDSRVLQNSPDISGILTSAGGLRFNEQGVYVIGAQVAWESNGTGRRTALIESDGGVTLAEAEIPANSNSAQNLVTIQLLNGNSNIFRLKVEQTSGGTLNLLGGQRRSPRLWAVRIA